MSKSLGGWIHSFTVTDTVTHKKGYTVYKITSIVFPRAVPEALTCITVWKRFNEVKKLYRDLSKRHKSLQLRGHVPEPKEITNFFKRFDPEVIQARKSYILQLLDFAAQHPALYKSHPFLNFLENGHTPNTSPIHHCKSNIEAICDSLDLTYDEEITLIDPSKDQDCIVENDQTHKLTEQQEVTVESAVELENNSSNCNQKKSNENDEVLLSSSENKIEIKNNSSNISKPSCEGRFLVPTISFEGDDNDYIYEAAYEFSQAVQAEVNQEYREAYVKYKSGVDKLLTGSKDDPNEERKFIAKAKVSKYMTRADELYEKYLLNVEDNQKTVQLSIDITDSSKEIYLERPWNQLSKFKVLQIIDTVMQVQDVTDKSTYIMKAIEKPSSNSDAKSIFLPQDVPYMVQLLGFFQSDTTIYLLLRQAKGGKLFDHVRSYTPTGHITSSLNEIFTEISSKTEMENFNEEQENGEVTTSLETENDAVVDYSSKCLEMNSMATIKTTQLLNNYDSGFVELINEYKSGNMTESILFTNDSECNDFDEDEMKTSSESISNNCYEDEETISYYDEEETDFEIAARNNYIPSFDILSEDMDVNDLVTCSQKLLRSVSNTLEQYKETKLDSNELLQQIQDKFDKENENKDKINNKENNIAELLKKETGMLNNPNEKDDNIQIEEFSSVVNKRIVLPEVSIKQWARELVTAIDSLHKKGVILGDLRPDNLLLGSKGQLLLSYFYQNEGYDHNTRNCTNFKATENLYVAPERPLTIKSDWWSFGIILFELLTGYAFKLCHPAVLSCYHEIQYPEDVEISDIAKDLLHHVLQYNPEYRIGIDAIKMHKFFDGTKWNDIAKSGLNSF